MLDLTVVRNRVVAASLVIVAVVFGALQGTGYVLTQYLQLVQGRSPMATGMVYAPTTIGWSLAAVASPWFVRRLGHRAVLTASVAVVALGYLVLATAWIDDARPARSSWCSRCRGSRWAVHHAGDRPDHGVAAPARAGVASALNDVSRQVGGAVGVAVLGSLLSFVFVRRVPALDNLAQAPGSKPRPRRVRVGLPLGDAVERRRGAGGRDRRVGYLGDAGTA